MALKMLLVRVDLSGISFVLGVREETVLAWLVRAAAKAHEINEHLLRDLPVTQVQLDEMGNFIARKHARETDEAGESLPESEDGRQWVWDSFAPEFRLMIAAVVGPRTLDTAKEVVAATKARVAGIPSVLQRRIHLLSGSAHRRLPRRDDICENRQAGAPPQARL